MTLRPSSSIAIVVASLRDTPQGRTALPPAISPCRLKLRGEIPPKFPIPPNRDYLSPIVCYNPPDVYR